MPLIIILCLLILVMIILSIIYVRCDSESELNKQKKEAVIIADHEKINRYKQKYKCKKSHEFEHLYGLNIPQGVKCDLWIGSKRLVAYYGTPITLFYTKIIKAEVIDQTEFKKHYIDNTTGAIAGGLTFGAIGALLAGGTKTVTETTQKYIFAVTYKSENEIKYILFNATNDKYFAKKFANDINYRVLKAIDKSQSIEL